MLLTWRTIKGSASEREALRFKTRTRAKRQNAERVQGRYPPFSQPYTLRGHFQRSQFASSNAAMYQQPRDSYAKEVLAGSVAPPDIGGESVPSGLPEPSPPEMLFTLPEQVPARPPHVKSRSQFLDSLSSSVSDLLSTGQGIVSTVSQPDVSQEFMTLMENKFTDNSSLVFYKQNLYEYVQGTAAAVFKGRLRAHLLFWIQIVAPPWVIETIRSGYVILFETIPPGVCLSNNRSTLEHGDFVSSAVSRSS